MNTRTILVIVAWTTWLVACPLPAYDLGNQTISGFSCFIHGAPLLLTSEFWPWIFAWLANITMLLVTGAFFFLKRSIGFQRVTATIGVCLSLLALGFEWPSIAAFLWIGANILLFYAMFHKEKSAK